MTTRDSIGEMGRPAVLVVDDTPENLQLMSGLLKDLYRVKVANSGERALKVVSGDSPPDLVLLDVMMPGMDGYEVCRQLKENPTTREIPVIFLTAKNAVADEERGFALGAVDYIAKPISPPLALARIKTQLALKQAADFLRDQNAFLEAEVQRRTAEVSVIQDVTIMAMASLAETRDSDTGNHILRTQRYVETLARQLKTLPRYADVLTEAVIETMYKSAPLHDIGKVGIPDRILLKPGPLTPDEYEIMKTHCRLGRDAIMAAERVLDSSTSFLSCAREIAYCHQEKWDGSGYPEGLVGEAIPLAARLMALADVYDALVTRRVYKGAINEPDAIQIILDGRGSHFDPEVVDAFLAVKDQFSAICARFSDAPEEATLTAAR